MVRKKSMWEKYFSIIKSSLLVILVFSLGTNTSFGLTEANDQQITPVKLYFIYEDITPYSKMVNIMADTNSLHLGFVKIKGSFDPSSIYIFDEITTSSTFGQVIKKTSKDDANATGIIAITLALTSSDSSKTGISKIAHFLIESKVGDFTNEHFFILPDSEIQMVDISAQELPFVVIREKIYLPGIQR